MSWTARLTAPFQRKFIQNTLTSRMQKRAYSGGVLSEEEALGKYYRLTLCIVGILLYFLIQGWLEI
jgi:hypothetical protein